MTKFCSHCGTAVADNSNFCMRCGFDLRTVRAFSSPEPARSPFVPLKPDPEAAPSPDAASKPTPSPFVPLKPDPEATRSPFVPLKQTPVPARSPARATAPAPTPAPKPAQSSAPAAKPNPASASATVVPPAPTPSPASTPAATPVQTAASVPASAPSPAQATAPASAPAPVVAPAPATTSAPAQAPVTTSSPAQAPVASKTQPQQPAAASGRPWILNSGVVNPAPVAGYETYNPTFHCKCEYCYYEFDYHAYDLGHRAWYPHGFVYCPRCQKPLRHKLEYEVREETPSPVHGMQPAPAPGEAVDQPNEIPQPPVAPPAT